MREIHPFNVSVDEVLAQKPELRPIVMKVRQQKKAGERPLPSSTLVDRSKILESSTRRALMDKIASLVDENYCGRSEMCQQFATLLSNSLQRLGFRPRIATGTVAYYNEKGNCIFKWPPDGHEWVVVEDEIVDCNIDSLVESLATPQIIKVSPYWGPRREAPRDRKYIENVGARSRAIDVDVEKYWWPELKKWLDDLNNFRGDISGYRKSVTESLSKKGAG